MTETQQGTAKGAAIGAAAGALLGAATGGSKRAGTGAIIGAGAGALGGYIWSKKMQEQKAAMEKATAGTGVGLANIRERLQLLYGNKASLTITENPGGGTRVVLAVPYKPVGGAA